MAQRQFYRLFALAAFVVACGGPSTGSESHFLERCQEGRCPEELACVCGVCTRSCRDASACEGGAECVGATEVDAPACDESAANVPRFCAALCDRSEDCSGLGARHVCEEGRCVADRTYEREELALAPTSECTEDSPTPERILYVCDCAAGADAGCQAGDDGGSGAVDAPLRTLAAAIAAEDFRAAGGAIALCRGGVFEVDALAVDAACTEAAPCRLQDYYPSDDFALARPRINSGSDGIAAGSANLEIRNLRLEGASTGEGVEVLPGSSAIALCGISIAGYELGVSALQGASTSTGVTIADALIAGNGNEGIQGAADDLRISRATLRDNGVAFDDTIAAVDISAASPVRNLRIEDSVFGIHGADGNECNSRMVQVSGTVSELRVVDSVFGDESMDSTQGCWGVVVGSAHDALVDVADDVVVARNRFVNLGLTAIGLTGCANCTVENNAITHRGDAKAISVPARLVDVSDGPIDNVRVQNNSIYLEGATESVGVFAAAPAGVLTLLNNAVRYEVAAPLSACFDLAFDGDDTSDFNLCWRPDGAPVFELNRGDLATWQGEGQDANSFVADPLFVGPFDLRTSDEASPLVDNGSPGGAADALGGSRDASPDIGAFER
ncbi:MAG: hypothetical protein AAGE52_10115 [Myxococcota bacterium]